CFVSSCYSPHLYLHSFPTRRSSDLGLIISTSETYWLPFGKLVSKYHFSPTAPLKFGGGRYCASFSNKGTRSSVSAFTKATVAPRSEEHTSELQSREKLVCRLLLEKK